MIEPSTLQALGFEEATPEWKHDDDEYWELESERGTLRYWRTAHDGSSVPSPVIYVWSGIGNAESYGYKIEFPTANKLRAIVDVLSEKKPSAAA